MNQATKRGGRWSDWEHHIFLDVLDKHGKNWAKVKEKVKGRTLAQIRSHAQKHFAKLKPVKVREYDLRAKLLSVRKDIQDCHPQHKQALRSILVSSEMNDYDQKGLGSSHKSMPEEETSLENQEKSLQEYPEDKIRDQLEQMRGIQFLHASLLRQLLFFEKWWYFFQFD